MHPLLRALYGTTGALARAAVAIGAPGDSKLARTINARRGLLEQYRRFAREKRDRSRPLIWFHAPSVGEGLQVTPVLARLRAQRPDVQVAYTHFSPSAMAFAARIGADFHAFLPFDIADDMRTAVAALAPDVLIFSKLDVWPGLVRAAHDAGVRIGMISATLAESSGRRSGLSAALTRDAYATLDAVGAIAADDAARLAELGVRTSAIVVTGDTRYDQVWARAALADTAAPWLARFRASPRPTLVAGSTWPADERVLLPAWQQFSDEMRGRAPLARPRLILAPHEPTAAHIDPLAHWARSAQLSALTLHTDGDADADVVLVDRVGVLGELYALADVAYVGGGFHSAGLHSVIEPAAYGAPVLFGPRHHASRDAAVLLAAGGSCSVVNAEALTAQLTRWLGTHSAERATAGAQAQETVRAGIGAADRATALVSRLLQR